MAITSFYLLNMFPRMRTLHHHPTVITQQPTAKHVPSDTHFTSSLNNQQPTPKLNMFPQIRTLHHHPTIITQHPSQNMFPRMRTLHHHPTINTQHPDKTCSLGCALYIITQQSTPITQAKHVPSHAHFTSSPNNHHPDKTCSLGCVLYIITQQSTPITQAKHVPSDAHFTSSPNNQQPTTNSHARDSIDFSIKLAC